MKLSDLRTVIQTNLNTLKGNNKPFVEVYNYHTLKAPGYPYVTFEPTSMSSVILDNCFNQRQYVIDVMIRQAFEDGTRATAMNILVQGHDTIIDLIDKDYTLGGVVEGGVKPIGCDFGLVDSGNGKSLFCLIKLECNLLFNIH